MSSNGDSEITKWICDGGLIKSISFEINNIPVYFCSECHRRIGNQEPKDFICNEYSSEDNKICESETWVLEREAVKDRISGDFIRLWNGIVKKNDLLKINFY